MRNDSLRHGDLVEVRTPAEILATLDDRGMLDGLPFMPEMLQYCGRRFVVDKRAEKICDMIYPLGSRRLPDTVLLEDLRCDGSGHGGCQAECRLFWKEAWLRRVGAAEPTPDVDRSGDAHARLARLVEENATQTTAIDGHSKLAYRCQATEHHRASLPVRTWDPRVYLREYTSGNVGFGRFLRISLRAALQEPLRKLGLKPKMALRGTRTTRTRDARLNLQPGELVQVKQRHEITATLNSQGFNRGLWFDDEMLPYCGGTFRVRQRITRFIEDRSGEMIELKSDAVTLDGAVCSGEHSPVRWFCPRASYPFWREAWLRRYDV